MVSAIGWKAEGIVARIMDKPIGTCSLCSLTVEKGVHPVFQILNCGHLMDNRCYNALLRVNKDYREETVENLHFKCYLCDKGSFTIKRMKS